MNHAPRKLRTDCGTENGIAAAMQSLFHQDEQAHLYGKSTANQRIEALWSKMRPSIQGWIDFFKDLVERGVFSQGNIRQTHVMRFVFRSLIKNTLQGFLNYWNTHHVRKSAQCEGGVPNILFYTRDTFGVEVLQADIVQAQQLCVETPSVTGDQDIDNYFQHVMDELQLRMPETKQQGLVLYQQLLAAAQ